MKQFKMDCFEVLEADGGGMYDKHVCFVNSLVLADLMVAKSKSFRRHRRHMQTYTIFDTIEEVEANSKENLRKSGLAKLSTAEKEALGL